MQVVIEYGYYVPGAKNSIGYVSVTLWSVFHYPVTYSTAAHMQSFMLH